MKQTYKRALSIIPALLLHVLWLYVLLHWFAPWATYINLILSILSVVFVLYIITNHDDATYKILWLLLIFTFPIFGTVLYLMFGNKRTTRTLKRHLEENRFDHGLLLQKSAINELADSRIRQTLAYIERISQFPLQKNENTHYYSQGEDMFPVMLESLKEAKRYVFIEYFILEDGYMWDSMLEILERKVKEGVDVRVMYDDVGSISTFSPEETWELKKKGIHCAAFNPLLLIRGTVNYRDHRKMMIIDGKIVFSGGINIADEYINRFEKHGHWKDIGFCMKGEPVKSYTVMFTEFWNAFNPDKIPDILLENETIYEDPERYDGYVLSYCDSPIQSENISNELYMELLDQAKDKAYFFTPYLMLGDSLLESFVRAAKRGVDVRIIMPGIPDKKLIFRMSRSFYYPLLESGVKIYEYTPGCVHAKGCVIDGMIGTVGTVNLDYRSLFLHFENNSLFYQADILKELETDFLSTQRKCEEKILGENIKTTFGRWFVSGVLRIFSPLC